MRHLPDCAAAGMVDKSCVRPPVFVLTSEDGEQSLACEPHAAMLLHQALSTADEVAVKVYSGN